MTCDDGRCIPNEWRCVGIPDCTNGEDEDCACSPGLASGNPELDACLFAWCCDELEACTQNATNVIPCADCFNAGGGPLCDPSIACWQRHCSGIAP